ncbi:MarR family transcriptional regulator [Actinomadura barringtoniae]|uniref:MarR family transcriptional regulator n=1 Tax=Actinomadura barringtoniae TaxID=1427535 RepID=A0A939TAC8_9ACTN|nr:MarR family transcriptional regulator [Actinomadura barringtoniae]MBO2448930.1 MarR family transcriptional regulator [Actinomadura barringtoniae]
MSDAVDAVIAQWGRERPDLDVWPMAIIGRLSRLSRMLDRGLREFFAEHGLERFEFDVLATLRRSGEPYELTAGALLKASMVTSGAITNRIDRMEAKGLVERIRDTGDRRSVRIRLTPAGLELIDKLVGLHVANEARMLAGLDPADRDQLEGLLRNLLESMGDTSLD